MLKLIRNDLYRVTHSFWNLLLFFVFIMCLIYFIVTISFSEMISIDSLKDKDILTEKTTLCVQEILIVSVVFSPIFNVIALSRDVPGELLNNLTMTGVKRSSIYYSRLITSIILYFVILIANFGLTFVVGKCIGAKFIFDFKAIGILFLTYSFVEIAVLSVYLMLLFWNRNLFWPCGLALAGYGAFEIANRVYREYLLQEYFKSDFERPDPSVTYWEDNYWKWIIVACLIAVVSSIIGEKIFKRKDL